MRKQEEKKERKERKRCPGSIFINIYAFNPQKKKLNILAEMLKISKKWGCISLQTRPPSL